MFIVVDGGFSLKFQKKIPVKSEKVAFIFDLRLKSCLGAMHKTHVQPPPMEGFQKIQKNPDEGEGRVK